MEGYRSFAVTVRGGSHKKSETVCQDVSNFYNDESVSLAVVADGHGDSNCFRSDKGAEYAVICAKEGIQNFVKELEVLVKSDIKNRDQFNGLFQDQSEFQKKIEKERKKGKKPLEDDLTAQKEIVDLIHRELGKMIREKLIRQTVYSWGKRVMDHFQRHPFEEQELEKASEKYRKRYDKEKPEYEGGKYVSKAYGTSLIVAAITPWYWFAYLIGDGRFSVLYKDSEGEQPVPWDPKCFLNVTTSICDDDVLDREMGVRTYLSMKADKEPPVAFFLCSDGIDDNYPADEKENAIHLYRLYREIAVTFAEDGYESTCGQIKDLANEFATKGKGDDTSLAGIVNIEELKKVAPAWKEKMAADEAERKRAKTEADAKAKAEAEEREEAAARKEARRAEREAEKAKAETAKENIGASGDFLSNDGQSPGKSEDKEKVEEPPKIDISV
jgi:serine/threonine protein phosphatase PrpC